MSKIPSQDRTLLLVTMVVITVVIDILTGWGGKKQKKYQSCSYSHSYQSMNTY